MKYIIEHLEPELYEWSIIEYKHISKIVGKENLIITNLPKKEHKKVKNFCIPYEASVGTLGVGNLCLLELDAEKELSNKDRFEGVVFGGILGDDPPTGRTKILKRLGFHERNLGAKQMSTDNAVFVAKQIVNGKRLSDIMFQDGVEIELSEGESVRFPFRYVVVSGKALISEELIKHLKQRKEF